MINKESVCQLILILREIVMSRFSLTRLVSLACLLAGLSSTRAANLSVSSAVFDPSAGSINIQVMLENNSGTVLNLAAFSFELEVTPVSPRRVEFDTTGQPITLTDPNYVFFGNSADQTTPTTPWAVNSTGSGVNNDFVFSDTTDNTLNMTVGANSSALLANIRLVPGTGSASPQAGDVFTLSFVAAGTSIIDENLANVTFTTGTGTLTATAVPEPSTYALALVGLGILAAMKKQQRKA